MAALLALAAALMWGAGDFFGGISTRQIGVFGVLALAEAVGLAGVAFWIVFAGDPFPGVQELLPAMAGGAAGIIGLAALYRGFAVGAMGIVAPISAASPLVPLAVDAAHGVTPDVVQWLGVASVVGGVVVLSRESSALGGQRLAAGVALAIVAAFGFGAFIVGLDAGSDESAPWAVVSARGISLALVLAVAAATSTSLAVPRRLWPAVVGVGVFDTAANVAVAFATTEGAAGIVAVLSALYPVVTVVLARIVLAERLTASRRIGGVITLAGAALVVVG